MKPNLLMTFTPGIIAILVIFSSCEKEKETVTETIIVHDTVTVVDFINLSDTSTTFFLVRHAETAGGGSNPNLNSIGQNRASELNRILSEVNLSAIFSTPYNRTMETATPIATDKSQQIIEYDPNQLIEFVDSTIKNFRNQIVLVVGHSNTTPFLLNTLDDDNHYPTIPESEYDNMFIVTAYARGYSKVVHLKYGN